MHSQDMQVLAALQGWAAEGHRAALVTVAFTRAFSTQAFALLIVLLVVAALAVLAFTRRPGLLLPATADRLHLSLYTVKAHVHNAFGKLDIRSRAQLAQVMH